jgi:undecaprenyl pyrophosphate phosphatase UppP
VFLLFLGLPLHILVVHFAVVLVPLAVIGFISTGWRRNWRATYSFPVAALALAGAAAAFLAAQSGGSLRRSIRREALTAGTRADFAGHPGAGNRAEVFAFVFAIVAVALWLVERRRGTARQPDWLPNATFAVGAIVGVLALVAMVVAGHSGATLAWRDLGNFVSPK